MDGDRWRRVREIFQTALEREAVEWPAVVAAGLRRRRRPAA